MNGKSRKVESHDPPEEFLEEESHSNIWATNLTVDSSPVIGIDLGTSNSCVGIWDVDKSSVKVIRNLKHERITPTTVKFVSFKPNEVVEIGSPSDDPLVLSGFKRFIGLTGEQITDSYINGSLPEGVTTNHNDEILFKCHTAPSPECLSHCSSGITTECRSPEDLSVLVLEYLKDAAEKYLIQKKILHDSNDLKAIANSESELPTCLSRVVIGVPHTFTKNQRSATMRAAERAGFTEVHLMVESTAAALGYGLLCAGSKSILVVDIGGGTTDVTITAIKDHCLHPSSDDPAEPAAGAAAGTGAGVEVKVMATAGHSQCGGRDVDNLFAWYLSGQLLHTQFPQQTDLRTQGEITPDMITPEIEREALLGLRQLAEKCRTAKELLSTEESALLSIPIYPLETLSHIHSLLGSSLSTYLLSSSSSTWKYANANSSSRTSTSSQVTSTHSSSTDLQSLYSDIIADIDAAAVTQAQAEEEELWLEGNDGGDMTWRTVPEAAIAPSPFRESSDPQEQGQGQGQGQGRTSRSQSTIHPLITRTSTSYDLTVTRELLSTLMTPLLIQIKGVISTAIDIYSLKKTREDRLLQTAEKGIDIDEVILVGGSSLIPSIQQATREVLQEKNIRSFSSPTPATAPATATVPSSDPSSTSASASPAASSIVTEKEFCSSICPYECVVNGLAVKAALLSGVRSSILQDILMIDVTPSAIGILVWVPPSPSDDKSKGVTDPQAKVEEEGEGEGGREGDLVSVFEALIPRGTPLPCRVRRTYEIDERCLSSGLLTLQLYEEIYLTNEEKISTALTATATAATGTDADMTEDLESLYEETKSSFSSLMNGRTIVQLGSYEVPIRDCVYRLPIPATVPSLLSQRSSEAYELQEMTGDELQDSKELEDTPWSVDLELSMNAEGILSYAVCPPPHLPPSAAAAATAASADSSERMSKESSSSLHLLSGYLFFLIVLYLAVKIQFPSLSLSSLSPETSDLQDQQLPQQQQQQEEQREDETIW